jgi:hypothetical protein
MTSEKQSAANRRNALQSTGPRTGDGIEAARFNALRHGLRALQTVVPGEAPEEWEAHQAAVVGDLKPLGAVEMAMAEQVAAKLWRLGRVVRHEADMIAIGQDAEEICHAHETATKRGSMSHPGPDDIPALMDLESAKKARDRADEKLAARLIGIRVLESLQDMKDDDPIPHPDWPVWDALKEDLSLGDKAEKVFQGEEDFVARHVRHVLKLKGKEDEILTGLVEHWRETKIPELQQKAEETRSNFEAVRSRYEAALDRLRRSRGLPAEAALDKIPRETSAGILDLHSTRHTFVSEIVAGGANVKTAQELARHSTPKLTFDVCPCPAARRCGDCGATPRPVPAADTPRVGTRHGDRRRTHKKTLCRIFAERKGWKQPG